MTTHTKNLLNFGAFTKPINAPEDPSIDYQEYLDALEIEKKAKELLLTIHSDHAHNWTSCLKIMSAYRGAETDDYMLFYHFLPWLIVCKSKFADDPNRLRVTYSKAIKSTTPISDLQEVAKAKIKKRAVPDGQIPKEWGGDTKIETKKQQELQILEDKYKDTLRLNLRGDQMLQNGKEPSLEYLYLKILREDGISIGKDIAIDMFMSFASENAYDPVRNYLNDCYSKHKDSGLDILNMASSLILGTDEDIYNEYLKKTMIGAVARTFNPGCKFDTALILQGKTGLRKSTFFATLAGSDFFDDTVGDINNDERRKMHSIWIEEWGEIERVASKQDVSIIKSFLSCTTDNFRVPYGRTNKRYPRRFIIVGSTNQVDFLQDTTGDRRFWIIPVKKSINIDLLADQRDILWSAAVHCYLTGHKPYLDAELDSQRAQLNLAYRAIDPWTEPIEQYLQFRTDIKMTELLMQCLKIETERHDQKVMKRVAEILRSIGFERDANRNGKVWHRSQGSQGSQPE